MLEDGPLTYKQIMEWLNYKINQDLSRAASIVDGNPSRHPFDSNHVNVRRLIVIRKKLIEGRKTDMGIKMFIKSHTL